MMRTLKYNGLLTLSAMPPLVKRAYIIWANQRDRCNDPRSHRYRTYGAKGIRVEYSSREFIDWYLSKIRSKNPTTHSVGRIDHSKNYSLDNIKIESRSENSKERIKRAGNPNPGKPVLILNADTNEVILRAENQKEAARITGIDHCNISGYCKGAYIRSRKGFTFRYA